MKKVRDSILSLAALASERRHHQHRRSYIIVLPIPRHRWIETEREGALLSKAGFDDDKGSAVTHEAEAFLALGHGPRICPGQVR